MLAVAVPPDVDVPTASSAAIGLADGTAAPAVVAGASRSCEEKITGRSLSRVKRRVPVLLCVAGGCWR